jgi:type II secretory pathway pseudopilin PulG
MSAARTLRSRGGVTLVELLISLLVAGLVLSAALTFFRQQGDALTRGTEGVTVLQNYRYAVATLRRDLRTVGTWVPDQQPFLVYAGADVVAFNADYASRDPNDYYTVYVDTAAPAAAVEALTRNTAITIPGTSVSYPDTNYTARGNSGNSPAETIIFFFAPDTTTTRSDDYVLYRQVNGTAPGVVARNLLRTPGKPFFEYYRVVESDTSAARVELVPTGSLPFRHTAKLHGAPNDTGPAARIDALRAVRVNLTATSGRPSTRGEQTRTTSRLIRLPNAGLATLRTCGEAPQLGVGLSAVAATSGGASVVNLTWSRAIDEYAGEKDVLRYVIWRKSDVTEPWGNPLLSIPSGQTNYTYTDASVVPGTTYYYALAAQDCTPSLSTMTSTGAVTP